MHDEFLHRLRRDPRPEFAARLQAQLRRLSTSPLEPRAPSRVRTLITLLLLGGTAFAITAVALKGLPASWLESYRDAVVWMIGAHTSPGHRPGGGGVRKGLKWLANDRSSPNRAPLRRGPAQLAASAASAPAAATSRADASTGTSPVGGALAGIQGAQVTVATSWSAYLYVLPVAQLIDFPRATNSKPIAPQVGVFVRDSDRWPGPMCGNGARAPDIGYAFEPVGTVHGQPCPRKASANQTFVIAIPFGYEAVALARSPLYGALDLTRREVFLALAEWVPDPRGKTVHENTNTNWRQIDAALGPEPIEFMGPPLSSAAGRSMIELLLEAGCKTIPWVAALESTDPGRYARICRAVRTDGVYVEVPSLSAYRLLSEPNAVGILSLYGGQDSIDGQLRGLAVSRLEGVGPTLQSIESGAYSGSRGLYIYLRRGRVMPNIVVNLLRGQMPFRPDSALVGLSWPQFQAAASTAVGPHP